MDQFYPLVKEHGLNMKLIGLACLIANNPVGISFKCLSVELTESKPLHFSSLGPFFESWYLFYPLLLCFKVCF